ncbi:hypothetical protein [Pseudomonas nunensis]|uniref:Uncharacterized protein n=1 Tax=Pseudomonas nunensis TaxID=2961896 RepID=A0ABY5ENK8_9PSED|nr:hypothetical protein [Pseudomonas nunensis]MCL5227258.1 hypothetical protein [Pseudomonas nunensis]UTO15790.1 hypothetical protein NK667_05385 [Pseudomonas nunensis]
MTAIALINAEVEPYLISDSLITALGPSPDNEKSIWIPALGTIKSEWLDLSPKNTNKEKTWHITRLGRKCFTLPDNTGMLAFADDCQAAYSFWDKLSDKINTNKSYDELFKVTLNTLHSTISEIEHEATKFSLLGIVIDENSQRTPFVHNPTVEFTTKNFGVCYASGSGAYLIMDIIKAKDKVITAKFPLGTISLSEDLAEHISAEMLYRESDIRNGHEVNSPLASFCGGIYEWHKIDSTGVRVMPRRIDLHFLIKEKRLYLSRIYLIEQMETPRKPALERYSTSIINLGSEFYPLPKSGSQNEYCTLVADENMGVLINSTFALYDTDKEINMPKRLSGRANTDTLRYLFSPAPKIARTRVTVGNNENTAITSRWYSEELGAAPVILELVNDQLSININTQLIDYAWNAAKRLSP